jgi:hypothetical protein
LVVTFRENVNKRGPHALLQTASNFLNFVTRGTARSGLPERDGGADGALVGRQRRRTVACEPRPGEREGPDRGLGRATELAAAGWRTVAVRHGDESLTLAIRGFGGQAKTPTTFAAIALTISTDPLAAAIFYREVPLPLAAATRDIGAIRWRLGSIASDE